MLDLPDLSRIRTKDQHVHDTFVKIQNYVNALAVQLGMDANKPVPPPQTIQKVMVSTAPNSGQVKVALVDKSPKTSRLINYFVDYATNPGFTDAITIPLQASRNCQVYMGAGTYFIRGYSQYLGSNPSQKVYYGGANPTAVTVQGEVSPATTGSQGSGVGIQGGFGELSPVLDPRLQIGAPL